MTLTHPNANAPNRAAHEVSGTPHEPRTNLPRAHRAHALLLLALLAPLTQAQTFLAADIHPSAAKGQSRTNAFAGGRYQIVNASLLNLITAAYGIHRETVYGGPSWIDTDRFDVLALTPPNATPADRNLMLRALLTERFALTTHQDNKPVPVFALLQTARRAQFQASTADAPAGCDDNWESGPPIIVTCTCRHTTMAAFAAELRGVDDSVTRPAVDLTGLSAAFDFTLKFTPLFEYQKAAAAGQPNPGIKFADALDKAGLRLDPRDHVLPVLAIDHVNRNPTPNPPGTAEKLPPVVEEFEVAEIKPTKPGNTDTGAQFRPGGVVEIYGFTLKQLMRFVWGLEDDLIVGGPKWIETDRYDIVAKAPLTSSTDDLLVMLKPLLIERFKLATHTDDRPVPVFFLTAARSPKLKDADPNTRSECTISRGQTGTGSAAIPLKVYTCHNTTMTKFAELIHTQAAGYLPKPVVDQTGIKGAYDFTLSWTRNDVATAAQNRKTDDGASDPTGAITVFEAVQHDLGLKLEAGKKFPMPVLLIDHAEPITADK